MSWPRVAAGVGLFPLVLTATVACQQASDTLPARAETAWRSGEYRRAAELYRRLELPGGASEPDRELQFHALRTVGEYQAAERAARGFPQPGRWTVALGELAEAQGRLAQADSLYRSALEVPAVALVARARLGELLERQGRRDEAWRLFRDVTREADRGSLTSRELAAAATAYRALGRDDPARYRTALRLYDAAVSADPRNLEARVALGWLFLEKYNRPDAMATFEGILSVQPGYPEALLGKARVLMAEGTGDPVPLLRESLEVNPRLVGARVALAMSHLDREDYEEATAEANRALEGNPASLEALTVVAVARLLRGDSAGYEAARARVFTLNPRYAEFYATLADQSARNRFYHRAVSLAAQGVEVDSGSSSALASRGLNQLRVGDIVEGRASLEEAFVLDPYNIWVKNTLDLLDVMAQYAERATARFRFVAAPDEVDLLVPYLAELAEEGYDRLADRYRYQPPTPIRVELYRHHADFSVRTVGLAGLGALGVSFGSVLAMDAPSALPRGQFNWGSTFWHELAHAFTLGATDHRIPRWFSEGLSVLEERRARPGWGAGMRAGFLQAYLAERLLPVSRLNDGFVRPTYPEQVPYSYYQAYLVCEMIEATRGPEAIGAMLAGYRGGLGTAEVFRTALGVEPELFDREFDRWFRERFAGPLDALKGENGGRFRSTLDQGRELLRAGRSEEARIALERARDLFPEYAESDSPHWLLARLHREAGRLEEAVTAVSALTALAESNYEANLLEAELRDSLGDTAGAAEALERAVYIDPREPALHRRLATLYAASGEWRKVVRERQAILALGPLDLAEAYYELALAWFQAGETEVARREVLRALEAAPAYEKAQDLLLRIRGRTP